MKQITIILGIPIDSIRAENALELLESGEADQETVNSAFRAVHSIKGGAGSFGMTELVRFAHVFETALDLLRSHKIEPTPEILQIFLRATDILSDLTAFEQGGEAVDVQRQQESFESLERLFQEKPETEVLKEKEEEEEDWGLPKGFVPIPVAIEVLNEPDSDQSQVDTPVDAIDGFEIFDPEPNQCVTKDKEEKKLKNQRR